jgi:hypothetical protein
MTIDIIIDKDLTTIYDDDIIESLKTVGDVDIKRVSHVEPVGSQWIVNFESIVNEKPVGPFNTRKKAIEEEVEIIKNKIIKGEMQ